MSHRSAVQSYVVLVEELFPDWDDSGGGKQQAPFAAPVTSTLKGGQDAPEVRLQL